MRFEKLQITHCNGKIIEKKIRKLFNTTGGLDFLAKIK